MHVETFTLREATPQTIFFALFSQSVLSMYSYLLLYWQFPFVLFQVNVDLLYVCHVSHGKKIPNLFILINCAYIILLWKKISPNFLPYTRKNYASGMSCSV